MISYRIIVVTMRKIFYKYGRGQCHFFVIKYG